MKDLHKFSELKMEFQNTLAESLGEREARSVFRLICEYVLQKSDAQLLLVDSIDPEQYSRISTCVNRVSDGEPVQYVLGCAHFYGRVFLVDKRVLIPRSETEELAKWIIESVRDKKQSILEIGTGSGCIAITLDLELENSMITAIDVSDDALNVAKSNRRQLESNVVFDLIDVFNDQKMNELQSSWDLIVSNPPYVPANEKTFLPKNVVDHEPHIALFSGEDTLHYYRRICALSENALNRGGALYFEIHEDHAESIKDLMRSHGFSSIEIKRDIHGRNRMIRGIMNRK
ncbi:MAG: peptide chain release factor N(5)-glutamine methyltransferase [Bacteroidia bacterium]|nr:peptide chain release factor N(5)-glutamine methyltransferase [Bacteroidia bacterium]